MGTWGSGNFDNDYARDYLVIIIRRLAQTIVEVFESTKSGVDLELRQIDSTIMPTLDVMVHLCESYKTEPGLDQATVEQWRDITLGRYDATIDEYLSGISKFKMDRRNVIEATFSKLIRMVQEFSD